MVFTKFHKFLRSLCPHLHFLAARSLPLQPHSVWFDAAIQFNSSAIEYNIMDGNWLEIFINNFLAMTFCSWRRAATVANKKNTINWGRSGGAGREGRLRTLKSEMTSWIPRPLFPTCLHYIPLNPVNYWKNEGMQKREDFIRCQSDCHSDSHFSTICAYAAMCLCYMRRRHFSFSYCRNI